jgi:hypothetical protein
MGTITEGPVCIIGMHRSGTSMIANLLNHCGLSLGPEERLLAPTTNNPMGHFEHAGFLEINEALLKYLGGSWDNPPDFKSGWERDLALGKFIDKANLLLTTLSNRFHWGWKEPRTTILLPFWQHLVSNLRFVICVRKPLEVARSLARRDGMSITAGAQLWNQYMRAAIRDTNSFPRIFTFYEDYFCKPLDEINRVSEFCGLLKPNDMSFVQNTISHELRHQATGSMELLNEIDIPLEPKLLYLSLRALSFEDRTAAAGFRDQCTEGLSMSAGTLLRLIDELRSKEKMARLQDTLMRKEQQLNNVRTRMCDELTKRDEQISQLEEQNGRLQAFSDAVRQTFVYRVYRFAKRVKRE